MNKYEKLIEYIINDDEARARALFHDIVVEKSREIYENIMDEEMGGDESEGLIDGVRADVDSDELGEADDEADMGDMEDMEDMDDMDDMDNEDDMDMDMDHEEHEEAEIEDRVMDLESALDELKAEFDALMAGEKEEPEHEEMFGGAEQEMPQEGMVREYVEKVSDGHGAEKKGAAEGHETGKGGSVSVNKTSIVAKKNDMGGTAANIAKGGAEQAADGTSPKKASNYGTKGQGNMPHAGKFENVPGARAGDSFGRAQKAKTAEEGSVNKSSIESGK